MRTLMYVYLRCAIAVVLLLPAGAKPTEGQGLPTIRVATTPNDSGASVFYALEMGFFKKAGVNVEIVRVNSAGLIGSSVASGSIDVGQTGISVLAAAHERGLPFVLIAPAGLYSSKTPTSALVVMKNAPLRTAADLDGKTVGLRDINSPAYVAARAWIDQNGGDSKTVRFVEMPDSAAAAALLAGRVDAASIAEPDLEDALRHPELRLFAYSYNAIANQFLLGGYFTTKDYAAAHPDLVRAFASAIAEAGRWANRNHAKSAEILEKYTKAQVTPTMPRVTYADRLTPALVQPLIDAAARYGVLKTAFPATELFGPSGR
jgi:NitT/TauT family transport system substrate-binding protein